VLLTFIILIKVISDLVIMSSIKIFNGKLDICSKIVQCVTRVIIPRGKYRGHKTAFMTNQDMMESLISYFCLDVKLK
jgi:hypothetical protein